MKKLFILLVIVISLCNQSSAQCVEPEISSSGPVVKKISFSARSRNAEYGLAITARVPGASWAEAGREAAVISVFLDGKYNQDIMVFNGSKSFDYKVLLGRVESGKHEIGLVFNRERSAKSIAAVNLDKARAFEIKPTATADRFAIQNSPFLYSRPNTVDRFSDIPLVTYYEILPPVDGAFGVRYTTIFTNEDGGTQTTALMARWGRATDIEWVYEVRFRDGERATEIFQGANHVTKNFKGKRIYGDHPLLTTATDNNNFADSGCSKLRIGLIPLRAKLSARSRESVMDENPWTYRIMAEEAMREGRVDPAKIGVNTIDDLRRYLYVEVFSKNNGTAVSVELTTNDGKTSSSDLKDERLRIARPGYQRIAVRLPSESPIKSLKLICHQLSSGKQPGSCGRSQIGWYVRLNEDLSLNTVRRKANNSRHLDPGEVLEWIDPQY